MDKKKKEQITFVADSRFSRLGKDALIFSVSWLFYFALTMLICYLIGGGDPAEYKYVMGLPSWYFWMLVLQLAYMAVNVYLLKKRYADVPLDPDDPEYDYEEV